MYQQRSYRTRHINEGMNSFQVQYSFCDLWIAAEYQDIQQLRRLSYDFIRTMFNELQDYCNLNPDFATALTPYIVSGTAPQTAYRMEEAAKLANVGPMAAVAGCFAQTLGEYLRAQLGLRNIIIENGGDIWLSTTRPVTVGLYAGTSCLSDKLDMQLEPCAALGICTSSATVGPSLSFGRADAVTVLAHDAAVADAFATAIANRIRTPGDIATQLSELPPEVLGCIIIINEHLGVKANKNCFQLLRV